MFNNIFDKFTNPILIDNLTDVSIAILIAFLISVYLTPFVGKFAEFIKAVDLPATMRKKTESSIETRIHAKPMPRLGGLAMMAAFLITIFYFDVVDIFPKGVFLGLIIIIITGFLDDKFEIPGRYSLIGQVLAAMAIIAGGNTILQIDIGFATINFKWYSDLVVEFAGYYYNFVFPADVITLLWIVGLINAVNWASGVDGLHGTLTSIALSTMLLIVLSVADNIPLGLVIAALLGANLGVLIFNYNPAKIYFGSISEFGTGYLFAVFAIFGGIKWAVTITILSLPLIDAIYVIYMRLKNNPEARRNPLKLLSISDRNHFHHRLLDAGYSKKILVLIEGAIVTILSLIAFYLSDAETEYISLFAGITIIIVSFALVTFLIKRNQKIKQMKLMTSQTSNEGKKQAEVKVITDKSEHEDTDYEKFIY